LKEEKLLYVFLYSLFVSKVYLRDQPNAVILPRKGSRWYKWFRSVPEIYAHLRTPGFTHKFNDLKKPKENHMRFQLITDCNVSFSLEGIESTTIWNRNRYKTISSPAETIWDGISGKAYRIRLFDEDGVIGYMVLSAPVASNQRDEEDACLAFWERKNSDILSSDWQPDVNLILPLMDFTRKVKLPWNDVDANFEVVHRVTASIHVAFPCERIRGKNVSLLKGRYVAITGQKHVTYCPSFMCSVPNSEWAKV